MSVSELLCEGGEGSLDLRLLRAVLRDLKLEIRPSGGKDGFPNLVRGLRRWNARVCGFVDGDFPRDPVAWQAPAPVPRVWSSRNPEQEMEMLGWQWRRKEVENYFIDPVVVSRALGWDDDKQRDYAGRLEGLFDAIGPATAARLALTACAPRKLRLETRVPLDATDDGLRAELQRRAHSYNEGATLDGDKLLASFEQCLPACRAGGRFRSHAIEVFAGKNIVARVQSTAGFPQLKNWERLAEKILVALAEDDAPHTWLPEWEALRSAVDAWEPAAGHPLG
jgi:hypothetical protein